MKNERASGIENPRRARWRWFNWLGSIVGVGLIGFLFWRQLFGILLSARPEYVFATFITITLEQVVRAWKWRQILIPLRAIKTSRLFGATMAGYLANLLLPLGLSPFVRSWLVAKKQDLAMSSVLATVAIDRLVDGIVFTALVIIVVLFAVIPDPEGNIGFGLTVAAVGSALAILCAFILLACHKRQSLFGAGFLITLADRLPGRLAARARSAAVTFADGIVWPREHWRSNVIILSSIVIKLLAASHLLWAGLAFDVLLAPLAYFALLAILGFIVILAQAARVPAGFVVGAIYALSLFGVNDVTAFAMVMTVMATNILAVAVFGSWGLWVHGVGFAELKGPKKVEIDASH